MTSTLNVGATLGAESYGVLSSFEKADQWPGTSRCFVSGRRYPTVGRGSTDMVGPGPCRRRLQGSLPECRRSAGFRSRSRPGAIIAASRLDRPAVAMGPVRTSSAAASAAASASASAAASAAAATCPLYSQSQRSTRELMGQGGGSRASVGDGRGIGRGRGRRGGWLRAIPVPISTCRPDQKSTEVPNGCRTTECKSGSGSNQRCGQVLSLGAIRSRFWGGGERWRRTIGRERRRWVGVLGGGGGGGEGEEGGVGRRVVVVGGGGGESARRRLCGNEEWQRSVLTRCKVQRREVPGYGDGDGEAKRVGRRKTTTEKQVMTTTQSKTTKKTRMGEEEEKGKNPERERTSKRERINPIGIIGSDERLAPFAQNLRER
ncbi:hypothetical protein CBR_g40638 [Chara braunii]|uniref:Uncharacterized protein n=1 Tax=Chara braunii TaxID=69332 RepID=A0A388LU25_CHABU|nr:hypothetical protein CBR_g40638 [Chara braunii]|eukprot:GBG85828.1 hypothetical protein CBR_g40638 [Chara braunii]